MINRIGVLYSPIKITNLVSKAKITNHGTNSDTFIRTTQNNSNDSLPLSFGSYQSALDSRIKELQYKAGDWTPEEREELIALVTQKSNSSLIYAKNAEEFTKSHFGISIVEYNENAEVAKLFKEALIDIKDAGIDLSGLKEIKAASTDYDDLMFARDTSWGKFDINHDKNAGLYYNSHFKWQNDTLVNLINSKNIEGYSLNNNPKSLIYHLVGHFLHFKTNSEFKDNFYSVFKKFTLEDISSFNRLNKKEKNKIRAMIRKEVSEYAFKKEHDFPAEVFTGLMNGKKFSPDIMKLYREIGMPEPKYTGP